MLARMNGTAAIASRGSNWHSPWAGSRPLWPIQANGAVFESGRDAGEALSTTVSGKRFKA
jgi:hypothetical protein